jgi:predicted metal-binding membrane protein
VRSQSSAAALPRRDRALLLGCILLVAGLAWAYLVYLDRRMSASAEYAAAMAQMGMVMDAPWRAADVLFTFLMWAVMMVGMMSASAAPVLLLFADMQVQRGARGLSVALLLFGLGYLAIWLGFSACAALVQWALHEAAFLSSGLAASSRIVGGAILIGAGVYQLTPVKSACLRHCQSPLGFLMSHWRDGLRGAFRMGLQHGRSCLGCCWALMGVLFAVGIMNLAWVAVLTAFILIEKVGSTGVLVSRAGGVVMIAYGTFLAAS